MHKNICKKYFQIFPNIQFYICAALVSPEFYYCRETEYDIHFLFKQTNYASMY